MWREGAKKEVCSMLGDDLGLEWGFELPFMFICTTQ
jgi:hypothetical protein